MASNDPQREASALFTIRERQRQAREAVEALAVAVDWHGEDAELNQCLDEMMDALNGFNGRRNRLVSANKAALNSITA